MEIRKYQRELRFVAVFLAIVLPLLLAFYLAYSQALNNEEKTALSYAEDLLKQWELSVRQVAATNTSGNKHRSQELSWAPPDVRLAVFSTEDGSLLFSHGEIHAHWVNSLGDSPSQLIDSDEFVLAGAFSSDNQMAAFAAIPIALIRQSMWRFVFGLLPIVLLSVAALLTMMFYLRRQQLVQQETTQQLKERVKELSMIHKTARLLMEKRPDVQDTLIKVAQYLPAAMQFPEYCESRIVYKEHEVAPMGWGHSSHILSSRFVSDDGAEGVIELAYLPEVAGEGQSVFLEEEQLLLDSVAEMLAAYLNQRNASKRMANLAYFERVTGLPNRIMFEKRLNEVVTQVQRTGQRLALLTLNLVGFRDIVSTLGYRNGEKLLRQVAKELHASLRDDSLLASMGGDQFVILPSDYKNFGDIDALVTKITELLSHSFKLNDVPISFECAIGVAIYPDHGDNAEVIMQRSEMALLEAKKRHRQFFAYTPEIDNYHPDRITLVSELPEAIQKGQLVLHYQPQVNLKRGRTVGVESLVRWQHPERGLIYPDQFLPLAEQTQTINLLTRWAIKESLEQLKRWRELGLDLCVSINLSVRNLYDEELCYSIPEMAKAVGVPLDRLIFELTESAIMADPQHCLLLLERLSKRGVVFSMDDFGIGESSLSLIKDLPISKIKIDKSFTIGIEEPSNAAIVRAALDMGRSLGMQVTAEGVENQEAVEILKALNCDLGQGYLFSKPVPADQLTEWLENSEWRCEPALILDHIHD